MTDQHTTPKRPGVARRLALVAAATTGALAVAAGLPGVASAMQKFSDSSVMAVQVDCDYGGLNETSIVIKAPMYGATYDGRASGYYRMSIYDHRTRTWSSPSQWVFAPNAFSTKTVFWNRGAGTFTFHAQYARVVNGQWQYRSETIGTCTFTQ